MPGVDRKMKHIRSHLFAMIIGMLLGMSFVAGGTAVTQAAGNGSLPAYPAQIKILVDGKQANIDAYGINGTTFVRLVDVGKEVDFNVYWDGAANAVQVESGMSYTGKASASKVQSTEVEAIRKEIVERTNAVRSKNGQPELAVDVKLMDAAQVRATELAATSTYSHTRPDGSKFNTVTDCPYVGENIHRITTYYLDYYDLELAEAAVNDWAASTAHLENILNPNVDSIGVGIAIGKNDKGDKSWYCVQLFLVEGCQINWVDDPITK